jgi:mono/diheme cytochrome c family protein
MRQTVAGRWSLVLMAAVLLVAFVMPRVMAAPRAASAATPRVSSADDQVARGRAIVITSACGYCHGGNADPASPDWLQGMKTRENEFLIGPCAITPGAMPCFHTRPRNLTPDNLTGLGRFSERQIFNALRYGLRPEDTPDVEITSTTPGVGNFPAHPHYLAPPMPWPAWRHKPDQDLWAIAAYLKRALKPVRNKVPDSEGPPDFWASAYTADKIGAYPVPAFPTANEQAPAAQAGSGPK